jgi:hypothetical protein
VGRIRKGRDMGDAGKRSGQSRSRREKMNAMRGTTNGGSAPVSFGGGSEDGGWTRKRVINGGSYRRQRWLRKATREKETTAGQHRDSRRRVLLTFLTL